MAEARRDQSADFASDDGRWLAIVCRDKRADGIFYYSVRTTGVYCRPACASRQPRRENVRFHATWQAAERAGFRACRRCRPNQPPAVNEHAAAVSRACRLIEEASDPPDLNALAAAAGLSRFHFHRVFRSTTGLTPQAYAAACRARRVREELDRKATVTQAMYRAGYYSSGRFYAASSKLLGMTPASFRRGGQGETIRFAVGECSLGAILVAATARGICSILLGDDPGELVHELEDRFGQAELIGGDQDFEQVVAQVVGFVESPALGLDLPLDVRGTAFQQRVWQALSEIPCGSTASYAEVARHIGAGKGARAVAAACAANPIAVAIPCHRVVRTSGSLAGYRWGIERKAALLEREREAQESAAPVSVMAAPSPCRSGSAAP